MLNHLVAIYRERYEFFDTYRIGSTNVHRFPNYKLRARNWYEWDDYGLVPVYTLVNPFPPFR
jgi:hypothetical protein